MWGARGGAGRVGRVFGVGWGRKGSGSSKYSFLRSFVLKRSREMVKYTEFLKRSKVFCFVLNMGFMKVRLYVDGRDLGVEEVSEDVEVKCIFRVFRFGVDWRRCGLEDKRRFGFEWM